MSKTLKKLWLSVLGLALVLSCAFALAFTAKTANADNTVNVNATVLSDSSASWSFGDNFTPGTLTSVQAGENGVKYTLTYNNNHNVGSGNYKNFDLLFSPANADGQGAAVPWVGSTWDSTKFGVRIMINCDPEDKGILYAAPIDSNGNELRTWEPVSSFTYGGSASMVIEILKNGSSCTFKIGTLDLTANFTPGASIFNSNLQTNIAFSRVNENLDGGNLTFNSYTAIGSSGSTPVTPVEPVTPTGAIVINSGTNYNANSQTGSFIQAGNKGFSFRFGASVNSAMSGYDSAAIVVGPYADMTNRNQNGVFMLSIMFNGDHQKLFLGYYDSSNTSKDPTNMGLTGPYYEAIAMTPGVYGYFTIGVVYNTTTSAWELRVNDTAIDNGVFNSKTGSSFMNDNYAFNFNVSNPSAINATITIDQFTAIGGGVPVTPPPAVDPLGTVTVNPGDNYNGYETNGALLQGGDYGFSFRFSTKINAPVTGFPGAEILIGPEADLSNTSATGHFKLGIMYNQDNQGLFISYSSNTTNELILNQPIPGELSTTNYLRITISVEYNNTTSKWELKINGAAIGGDLFNNNTGSAFMNANHQFNMRVGNQQETNAVIVLDQFQVKGLCKVYFVVGGGLVDEAEVYAGAKITTKPEDPILEVAPDLEFDGWFNNGEKWDFANDTVKGSMLLEAGFKETEIQEIDIDDGGSEEKPDDGGEKKPDDGGSGVNTDDGGGCGGSIAIEAPIAALALTAVAAAIIIIKKRRA